MRKVLSIAVFITLLVLEPFAAAELTPTDVGIIPKLTDEETADAPELYNAIVYPSFGMPCMNFTYMVTYRDNQGREPSYVRIWLNSEWYDMTKIKGNYSTGALYTYNYVPTSGNELFYYFEASNGVGKARDGIIDSPDQGPVLYEESLDNNQIILLDDDGNEIWTYGTGSDWIEGVAISDNSEYIAAVTGRHIYIFSKDSNEPILDYCIECNEMETVNTPFNGIDISGDGEYIAGTLGGTLFFFSNEGGEPLWSTNIEQSALGVSVSEHGDYIAVGGGGKAFLFSKDGTNLWEYKPTVPGYEETGNFYRPAMTPDGNYVAVSTGCPDRKAYLFSTDGDVIFRTEQLTNDSPVHKSAISSNGEYIAYSLDNSQGSPILILFDNDGNEIWRFSTQADSTARAVSMSSDGEYIALGTSSGNIYFFSKDSNDPIWSFSDDTWFSKIGEVKLNSDGSMLAAGGSTKKVYMFSTDSNTPIWEYEAATYVTFLDFNGEYVVAGTGVREFMFEGNSASHSEVECEEIINFEQYWESSGFGLSQGTSIDEAECGNTICEGEKGETYGNCPQDCIGPDGSIQQVGDSIENDSIDELEDDLDDFKDGAENNTNNLYTIIIGTVATIAVAAVVIFKLAKK